jgi:hypothetical protein
LKAISIARNRINYYGKEIRKEDAEALKKEPVTLISKIQRLI